MKRLVLSLVTALSLMGAAQSFAVVVPVTERLNFRGVGQTVDSAYATFPGSNTLKYSQAIPTFKFADPLKTVGATFDGAAANGSDSTAWALFRISPLPNSAVTVSADTLQFAIQVSANGTDWLTWTPVATLVANVTSNDLGTNKAFALVEAGTTNSFYHVIRQDQSNTGYPFSPVSNLGVTASTVTDAKHLLIFPFIRVVLGARATAGQYRLDIRYFEDKPGAIEQSYDRLWFRHNSTAFFNLYSDSAFASSNGATGTAFAGAAVDTTAPASMDRLCLPDWGGNAGQVDSLIYAALTVTTSTDGGATPANFDSVFVTPQISFDGASWISLAQRGVLETVGLDASVLPFKQSLNVVGLAWPNGPLVPIFSGGTILYNRMYGIAPLVRFIIRRDVDYTGALVAYLRSWKHVKD